VDRIIQIIRSLSAAESDREREALRGQLAAEIRGLSAEQLTELREAVRAEATTLAAEESTPERVSMLELLAEQHGAVREELASREGQDALSQRSQSALAAMDNQHDGHHDPARDAVQPPEVTPPADPPAADPPEGGGAPEGGVPEGQQAAGEPNRERNLGGLANGGVNPERGTSQIGLRTIISGDVPGFTAGTEVTDQAMLTRAFINKANAINSASSGGRYDVAHFEFDYPASHVLGGDYATNMERIHEATTPQSLVAAAQSGGLCLPLEVIYDIDVVGVTDRPVRDSLTPFRVERGGIQYRLPFDALAMTSGLGVWGQDNDQSVIVNPTTGAVTYESGNDSQGNAFGPKSCFVVDCPGVVEASIYSTYMCLEFANMTSRFDTEWVTATNLASQVAWARFAENLLLARILTASKIVYGAPSVASGAGFSAVREMLANYDKVISYYRNRHRLNTAVPLHTILPQWLIGMLQTDIARMMNTSGDLSGLFGVAQATIETWFRTRNVNVTWHLDGLGAQTAVSGIAVPEQGYDTLSAGQSVPGWPNAVDTVLYREGDWLFLDGGTLDIGLVRDSQLNLRNRYQTFTETFEGVAFKGLESLRVIMPLVPNGASSGTIAPPALTDGMSAYTEAGG
jgi:hypothetical protein